MSKYIDVKRIETYDAYDLVSEFASSEHRDALYDIIGWSDEFEDDFWDVFASETGATPTWDEVLTDDIEYFFGGHELVRFIEEHEKLMDDGEDDDDDEEEEEK